MLPPRKSQNSAISEAYVQLHKLKTCLQIAVAPAFDLALTLLTEMPCREVHRRNSDQKKKKS